MNDSDNTKAIYGLSSPLAHGFEKTLEILGHQSAPKQAETGAMPIPLLSQYGFIHDFDRHKAKLPFIAPCRSILDRWVSVN